MKRNLPQLMVMWVLPALVIAFRTMDGRGIFFPDWSLDSSQVLTGEVAARVTCVPWGVLLLAIVVCDREYKKMPAVYLGFVFGALFGNLPGLIEAAFKGHLDQRFIIIIFHAAISMAVMVYLFWQGVTLSRMRQPTGDEIPDREVP